MDAETKEALRALIGEPKVKPTFKKDEFVAWNFPKASEPSLSSNIRDIPLSANIKDTHAVLSVNQAKACIVLRAQFTGEVLRKIQDLTKDSSQARWNAKDEVLELDPTLLAGLKLILKEHYADVNVLGVQKQVKATKFDLLLARLSVEDKGNIYKLLARKYHPDLGGDKETMTLINLVFK